MHFNTLTSTHSLQHIHFNTFTSTHLLLGAASGGKLLGDKSRSELKTGTDSAVKHAHMVGTASLDKLYANREVLVCIFRYFDTDCRYSN